MTGKVDSWLPPEVAARDAVRSRVSSAVDDWSGRWLARRRLRVSALEIVGGAAKVENQGWLVFRAGVAVACGAAAASRLTNWALDLRSDLLEPTAADQELLAAFRGRMLDDLLQTIETALDVAGSRRPAPDSVKDPFGPTGGVLAALSDDRGSALLQLAIPLRMVMPLCQAALPARSRNTAPLSSLREAMNAETVKVEATLGAAEIPLQELRRLTTGDIIVLDRRIGDLIDLSVCESEEVVGRATLDEVDGQIALTLHA